MKNILKYGILTLIALVGAAIFSSCEDDQRYGGDGETMPIMINVSTESSGTDSRAVFEPDDEDGTSDKWELSSITRCLLLIYNGTGNEAMLVYATDISDPSNNMPMSLTIPRPGAGKNYRAIMLGNVNSAQLGEAAVVGAQLKDLNDCAYEISSNYNNPASSSAMTDFTWSGYSDYTSESVTLGFTICPNVAKVKVSVTDNSSESDVLKVQVRNVPDKVRFAQNALSKGGNFVDGTINMTYIDYKIESLDLSKKKGQKQTLYWYLPHNEAGTGNRESDPVQAPANATWVEFDGMRTTDFLYTDYRIYPGQDENGVSDYKKLKNFNIKADYQYRLNVNISSSGVTFSTTTNINDPASGVAVNRVKLPYNSNCYMIHPLASRSANGTLYELPINRINEYWGSTYGINDATMQIGSSTQWEAYVIWQDIPRRAIYFADKNGNTNTTSTVYSGTGLTPIYFKLADQDGTSATQTYGNVLIGVREKGKTTCLWSWHLWITDYNPDAAPTHTQASNLGAYGVNKLYAMDYETYQYGIDLQGVYNYNCAQIAQTAKSNPGKTYYTSSYNVTYATEPIVDANVQHYHSNNTSYWKAPSSTVWDSGIYSDKWIMDRNLGAQAAGNLHIKEPLDAWGLYYQFGRKDPFSYRLTYDINGNQRASYTSLGRSWQIGTNGSIKAGVQNPNVFYKEFNSYGPWSGSSAPNTNVWYNPTNISDGKKSVFDPCPPGWCVPDRDAFDFAKYSSGTVLPINGASTTEAHALFYIYFDAHGSIVYPYSTSTYATISLSSLNDRHRHMAMLCPSNTIGTSKRFLYTAIPMQGFITAEDGVMSAVLTDGGTLGTAPNARGLMWCARPITNGNTIAGEMVQIQATTSTSSGASVNPVNSYVGARLTYVYYGWIRVQNDISWKAARGQNVRCIQANDDTPKFYEE